MDILNFYSQILGTQASSVTDALLRILGGLAAVGVVSMAIVEIFKALRFRALFNAIMFRRFVANDAARHSLQCLAVGGGALTFYTMKADAFVDRLRDVVQSIVIYPSSQNEHVAMAIFIAGRAPGDLSELYDQFKKDWGRLHHSSLDERDDARERFMQVMTANLKGLHIRLTHVWELVLKILAIATSTVVILFFVIDSAVGATSATFMFAALGGMIAPVAHDVLSAVADRKKML